jgi:hypothetical protein
MNRFILILLLLNLSFSTFSQDTRTITVSFIPIINNEIVKINKDIVIDSAANIKIVVSKLKFYISQLSFYKDEKLVWQDKVAAHLMDAENDMSINLSIKKDILFNEIKFGIGIDSITNVSGALDGDLDPLKGMYWTWQSGYVNFKLEGTMPDKNWVNQKFEYHLGGYSGDYNSYNTISLDIDNANDINVSLDIDKFISNWYVGAHPNIMSPGKIAVDFSKILASCFNIK